MDEDKDDAPAGSDAEGSDSAGVEDELMNNIDSLTSETAKMAEEEQHQQELRNNNVIKHESVNSVNSGFS